MALAGDYILISVPNKQLADDPAAKASTYNELKSLLSDCAEVFKFHLPQLRTGTLERLMQAADNLTKVDSNVEQLIRKIERQLIELNAAETMTTFLLTVEERPVLQYVESFNWNAAKYPVGRQVDDLTKVIIQQSAKLEDELKESTVYLQEKKALLTTVQRKKEGNLTVVDLKDILTSELLDSLGQGKEYGETEYLKDAVLIIPKNQEDRFLKDYESLADDIVGYGESGDRDDVRGSPVVPGSAVKAFEDKEGYRLYLVTILKDFYEEFKRACLGNRYIVRDYDFKKRVNKQDNDSEIGYSLPEMKNDFSQAEQQMKRWCSAHYGEVFTSWIHIKGIRIFVESCLRYGIPANFTALLIKPLRKSEGKVRKKLMDAYKSLDSTGMMHATKDEIGPGGEEEVYPYVSLDLSVFASNE